MSLEAAKSRLAAHKITRITMLGGQALLPARRELESQLGVKVDWKVTSPTSIRAHEAAAGVKDAQIIILLTRWLRHEQFWSAQRVGREKSIPLLRDKGGYNVHSIANTLVEQLRENDSVA